MAAIFSLTKWPEKDQSASPAHYDMTFAKHPVWFIPITGG